MAISKLTMKVFLMDKFKNLSQVEKKILKRTYSEPLFIAKNNAEQANSMSESEKNFYYNWDKKRTKLENVILSEKDESVVESNVLEAYAELECPTKIKLDSHGRILPKKDRINIVYVRVVFFEIKGAVYLLIFSSNETYVDRVQKLIGSNLIKTVDKEYKIEPDLFNWLFYKYSLFKGKLTDELLIKNISGFIGNSVDEHNIFKGFSDQTSELIITKAFISNGEILKNVTVRIASTDGDFVFSIDHVSNISLFVNQSTIYFNSSNKEIVMSVYLYHILIPLVKEAYKKSSKEFLNKEKNQFSVKIGLEVIKSIVDRNSISLSEIEELYKTNAKLSLNKV